jgi:hypothetical protein
MILVSTGSANYEVSLLNLESATVDVLLSVDDRVTRDSVSGGLPTVPSFLRESVYFETELQGLKKNETNASLLKRYL